MRLGGVARSFTQGFANWETRSKLAFGLAAVLLVVVFVVGGRLPAEARSAVVIGVIGLLVTMQGIFLYANRNMVTPYTQAQRLILDARYEDAISLLENSSAEPPDAQTLTLLGSAYRMAGRVDESRQILTKALQMSPKHHFSLYSFGRTLLASGQYAEAEDAFRRSVENGAPPFARVDLAEAAYRAGRPFELEGAAASEPHVVLMASYLQWRTGQGKPPETALIEAGLPYWEKTAARFAHTPYGPDVQRDIDALRDLLRQS
jgi:tetratricopeptide (TPR) repeat protein